MSRDTQNTFPTVFDGSITNCTLILINNIIIIGIAVIIMRINCLELFIFIEQFCFQYPDRNFKQHT